MAMMQVYMTVMLAVFQARRVTCKSSDDESSSGGTASAGKKEHNGLSEAGPLADKEEQLHNPTIVTCTRGEYYQKATRQR